MNKKLTCINKNGCMVIAVENRTGMLNTDEVIVFSLIHSGKRYKFITFHPILSAIN